MLGARTVLGRTFTAAEGAGEARYPVAVLANGYWKRRFGADPGVIGKTFTLNSEPYTVIGVLAPDFYHLLPTDLYVPWPIAQLRAKPRVDHDFGVIARLRPGVTFAQAQVELSAIARRIDAQTPRLAGWDVTVVGMKQALFHGEPGADQQAARLWARGAASAPGWPAVLRWRRFCARCSTASRRSIRL